MDDRLIISIIVVSVCVVFVGSFIASLFLPNYQGAAVFAPVMTGMAGAVTGIILARSGKDDKK